MSKNLLKSIGAVLAAIILGVGLSIATDTILEKSGIFPPPPQGLFVTWMLAVAFLYRCLYGVAGSYLAAALAPNKPMLHAMIPGYLGLVASIIGVYVGWNLSQHWYPIALVISALPCAWLGGKLKTGISKKTVQ